MKAAVAKSHWAQVTLLVPKGWVMGWRGQEQGRSLGETKEACAVFQMGDLGLPVKDADNVGKEISTIYLKALCQILREKNTHAWWSKCTA